MNVLSGIHRIIVLGIIIIGCFFSIFFLAYLLKIDDGFCLSESKILPQSELKNRAYLHLIYGYKGTNLYSSGEKKNSLALIYKPFSPEKLKKIIMDSGRSEKKQSILEVFSMELINFDYKKPIPSDVLKKYNIAIKSGGALVHLDNFNGNDRISYVTFYFLGQVNIRKNTSNKTNFFDKINGFSKYEISIPAFTLSNSGCCGVDESSESPQKNKLDFALKAVEDMNNSEKVSVKMGNIPYFYWRSVSNCGIF
jgi:hypothetical protein